MQVESLARIGGENEAMCWWCIACTAHREILMLKYFHGCF